MTEPEFKTKQVDATILKITGIDRKKAVISQVCPLCQGDADEFRDARSEREQSISGLCQKCQDELF